MRNQTKQKGFTLIEVMFSLIIFMVAIMGLVALQKVSIEGASKGKRHTAAVNAASFFLTQLQNEISCWGGGLARPFPNANNTFPMLTVAIGGNQTLPDSWFTLEPNPNPASSLRVDELLGHSGLASGIASSQFCINYRISCLEEPRDEFNNTVPCTTNIDRVTVWLVRVRVSWPKKRQFESGQEDGTNPWTSCAPVDVDFRVNNSNTDDAVEIVGVATRELAI